MMREIGAMTGRDNSPGIEKNVGFNFDTAQAMLIVGTTRSGKTTAMLNLIEQALIRGEPAFIISGKNGAYDPYSMFQQVQALCNKYQKKLYTISTHFSQDSPYAYNPFRYTDTTGISDCMKIMARFSDTYYESNFEFYVICCCELLELAGKQKSLQNIMKLFEWKKYTALVETLREDNSLTEEEAEEYLSYKDIGSSAAESRARFLKYLRGSGRRIFSDLKPQFSVEDVRRENAVVMFDLDGLTFEDFSFSLGVLITSDLRTMISNEKEVGRRKIILIDELSVVFNRLVPTLLSQCAGFGFQVICGTQSFADLDNVDPVLTERVIENCNLFGIMKQNSPSDAERAAAIIGTEYTTETTRRKNGALYDEVGSDKVVRQFAVHPDVIKSLDTLEMIFYDKTKKGEKKPVLLKWHYLKDIDI